MDDPNEPPSSYGARRENADSGGRPPEPNYDRFYNETHYPLWPGAPSDIDDVERCHPELFDDPLTAVDEPYADWESWPDNDRWLGGRPPRRYR